MSLEPIYLSESRPVTESDIVTFALDVGISKKRLGVDIITPSKKTVFRLGVIEDETQYHHWLTQYECEYIDSVYSKGPAVKHCSEITANEVAAIISFKLGEEFGEELLKMHNEKIVAKDLEKDLEVELKAEIKPKNTLFGSW